MVRLAPLFETDRAIATAGQHYFDEVADELAGDWRTILRSGYYLTHDDGLYHRTSPLRQELRPALSVWAQCFGVRSPASQWWVWAGATCRSIRTCRCRTG